VLVDPDHGGYLLARDRGNRPRRGEDVIDNQLVEDLALALLGECEMLDRVVGGGCLWKSRKHGRLRPGEFAETYPEVPARGSHIAPEICP